MSPTAWFILILMVVVSSLALILTGSVNLEGGIIPFKQRVIFMAMFLVAGFVASSTDPTGFLNLGLLAYILAMAITWLPAWKI